MANAAGMPAFGVTTGVSSRIELLLAGARAVFTGPATLGPALLLDEPTVRPVPLDLSQR